MIRAGDARDPWAHLDNRTPEQREEAARDALAEHHGDTCGCWHRDCGECGPRLAGGERPSRGAVRAYAMRHEAAMQRARERAVRDGFA